MKLAFILFFNIFCLSVVLATPPATPKGFEVVGYEKHIDISWKPNVENDLSGYQILRAIAGQQNFQLLKTISKNAIPVYLDWLSDADKNISFDYKITAVNSSGEISIPTTTISSKLKILTDEEWLDMTERATFRYFWDYAHPVSGMARERTGSNDVVTTGGSGFGIMAILVGIERKYIRREEGLNRIIQIASFLQIADKYHGTFPHWMNGNNGNTIPFSQYDDGADLVETSFLMQGLLTARQYFDQNSALETDLRTIITQLWEGVEYKWFRQGTANVLYWHWSPKNLWKMDFALRGFNETHIVYLLAKASPKHSIPSSLYSSGWAGQNYVNGQRYYGIKLDVGGSRGGPLFFSHYSYLGFDPRNKKDAYCNYFERNKAHTLINRAYCIENPKKYPNYSESCWGLTASDNPTGYSAHEPNNDNGTITPTAALSSMPYAPSESLAALKHFYSTYGKKVWGEMGFYDAFNVSKNWYSSSYLAIDQGPIIDMIENYRTGLLWNNFMKNPEISPALASLGFISDNTDVKETPTDQYIIKIYPIPINNAIFTTEIELKEQSDINIKLIDSQGLILDEFCEKQTVAPGKFLCEHELKSGLVGTYFLQITINKDIIYKKITTY